MSAPNRQTKGDVLEETRTQKPKRFKVLIHNDDYTTMEFVVSLLMSVFKHTPASATRLMLAIHRNGLGVAGVYTKEIAETRVEQAIEYARSAGHPLQCTLEPE